MAPKIVFNGREYDGAEAMPPDVRRAWRQAMGMFADNDGDGIPDAFQGANIEPRARSGIVDDGTSAPTRAVTMPMPDARRSHGDVSPRWGEERPHASPLPWILFILLLAGLSWVLLR